MDGILLWKKASTLSWSFVLSARYKPSRSHTRGVAYTRAQSSFLVHECDVVRYISLFLSSYCALCSQLLAFVCVCYHFIIIVVC